MPRSIVLFVNLQPPVDAAAAEMERLTGLAVKPGPAAGTWSLDEGDVHAELHAHSYGERGDVLLNQFPLALTCMVADEVRLADAPETVLLRLISESLRGAAGEGGDALAGPGS